MSMQNYSGVNVGQLKHDLIALCNGDMGLDVKLCNDSYIVTSSTYADSKLLNRALLRYQINDGIKSEMICLKSSCYEDNLMTVGQLLRFISNFGDDVPVEFADQFKRKPVFHRIDDMYTYIPKPNNIHLGPSYLDIIMDNSDLRLFEESLDDRRVIIYGDDIDCHEGVIASHKYKGMPPPKFVNSPEQSIAYQNKLIK